MTEPILKTIIFLGSCRRKRCKNEIHNCELINILDYYIYFFGWTEDPCNNKVK